MTNNRPGEQRLKEAIRWRRQRPLTRDTDPKPYDEYWGGLAACAAEPSS